MAKGLWYRNIDLHVHTPASNCFLDKTITPEAIIQQAISVGLNAIAITDHNTATWIDRIKVAAKGTKLTVFPGVEITVEPGVHVLAIFPEDRTGNHITDLLAELGLGADTRDNPNAVVTSLGIQGVLAKIEDNGALAVLAHIDAKKGVWNELKGSGQTLVQLWNSEKFAAAEIVGDKLPPELTRDPFQYRPAFYWASDNPDKADPTKHSIQGIGNRFSRFKLDDPISWEGLRHCFQDPDVRIQRGEKGAINFKHPVLERITIDGGFLTGLDINLLTPNLNAIIGGRGTGKSSLLELIRYAFDIDAKTEANGRQAKEMINSERIFPPGSLITIYFTLTDGTKYRVERRAKQQPMVYRVDGEEPIDVKPSELCPLQVYGQKEIYEISKNPSFQLNLLDNYIADDLKPLKQQEIEILRLLRDNAVEILHLDEDIASAQEWLSRLGGIKEELRRMERNDFVKKIEQKKFYDQEQHLINQTEGELEHLLDDIDGFIETHHLDADQLVQSSLELPNHDLFETLSQLLKAIDFDLTKSLHQLSTRVAKKWSEANPQRTGWKTAYETQERTYQELLKEFQGSEDADRYIQLLKRKTELQERDREVKRQKSKVVNLHLTRDQLLNQLRTIRRNKYDIRSTKAEELTKALNKKVRITVYPQGNREPYKEYLQGLLSGLNVRNPYKEDLAQAEAEIPEREPQRPTTINGETTYLVPRIPHYFDPIDLAHAISIEQTRSDEGESILKNNFKIDSDGMLRNIAGLTQNQLYELETHEIEDLPIIELQLASGDLGYRELGTLSVGQRCTALLSLVLLESPAPLVIDQPEDDLDNQFIFDQIVATLRSEKEKRQFIIATHNANIPVSGDAELIIVLHADVSHGAIKEDGMGSIDNEAIKQSVELLLEGGEAAFKIRKEKYGIR
jgi:ABC-type lipoprotein export system ATPase subunit